MDTTYNLIPLRIFGGFVGAIIIIAIHYYELSIAIERCYYRYAHFYGICMPDGWVFMWLPASLIIGAIGGVIGGILGERFLGQRINLLIASLIGALFGAIFLAELADKTQFVGISMSAKSGKPLTVWLGSVSAYIIVTAISVLIGATLGKYIKPEIIRYSSASLFIVIGLLILLKKI